MRQISSKSTFFHKRLFPIFWFGFIAIFVFSALSHPPRGGFPAAFLFVPVLMAVIGYVIFKKFLGNVADKVLDAGDSLVVIFGNDEDRIPLSEIINVSHSELTNPQRITLTLRHSGRFGKEISFLPPSRFLPFSRSPIATELIERADAARRT